MLCDFQRQLLVVTVRGCSRPGESRGGKMAAPNSREAYKSETEHNKWEELKKYLWNSDTKQCMGRTGKSWCQVFWVYVILYILLAAFWIAMLKVFYLTLDDHYPKWQKERSIIGTNPGLGFRPMPDKKKHPGSSLVRFNVGDDKYNSRWVHELDEFLESYRNTNSSEECENPTCKEDRVVDCNFHNLPDEEEVCRFDIDMLQDECRQKPYGFDVGRPCILLKLNKIYGLVHDTYDSSDEVPTSMPQNLQEHIKMVERQNNTALMKMVWVSCDGEDPADKELLGSVTYRPHRGFPLYYFPFLNQKNYQMPIVMVQFRSPVANGVMMSISCTAWAKNIERDRKFRRGMVHFELLID